MAKTNTGNRNSNDTDIPDTAFYGETRRTTSLELLHCEPLVERSRQHNWKINPHRHSGITQLFYVHKGEAIAHVDGQQVRITAPCIFVIPEACVHDFDWSENIQGHVLSVATALLNRICEPLGGDENALRKPVVHDISDNLQLVGSLFENIAADYQQQFEDRELMLEALITALIIHLNRHTTSPLSGQKVHQRQDRGRAYFSAFLQLVEQHCREQWKVADYAQRLGITAPHLNSICRKLEQQSALQIVHQRLLLEAKRSLIYTGRSITEISWQLGFADTSHFTRFFKNKTGGSPREFRKSV